MATYSELVSQISELQKQADKQRKEEYSSVVRTIKKQIAEFGISASELGFVSSSDGKKSPKLSKAKKLKRSSTVRKVAPKYRDHTGNTWSGRGKMPRWLVQAIANGQGLESFKIVG